MHPAVAATFDAAVIELSDMGIEVIALDVELSGVEIAAAAGWTICCAEMLSLHEGHFPTLEDRDAMGAGMLAAAPFVSAADYLRALRYRSVFQAQLAEAMDGCVGLVLPGNTTVAPLLDDMLADVGGDRVDWLTVATRNHIPFNYAGLPGAVPALRPRRGPAGQRCS